MKIFVLNITYHLYSSLMFSVTAIRPISIHLLSVFHSCAFE